ncbi:carboxy-S-adenosyl-L-methionine synthase CmoA [Glaciecola petra]|uniref:Carboxy-S-adenosyl-L-methionine synthase n=1 Tax=Glaciecola petra TaxID=3075602 RepID=A0ABU2ZNY0_9ALTE|nr:carboxy-S-adenosyl-L-methionine synthase CmoA [Aestuariibacter sp. P117]MDT0594310.1 carboxy-S-adenosyl-L-methionine synthase CmoA [Aestuariibacter sp. P117]
MKKSKDKFAPDTIYSEQLTDVEEFSFNKQVVDVFPDMINRSVPGYQTIIDGIGELAALFCPDNAQIYDLGCSIGEASLSIAKRLQQKKPNIEAIDNSQEMIERCEQHVKTFQYGQYINIHKDDITLSTLSSCHMVVINFTLQFLAKDTRQGLIEKIYQSLAPGGILILSEKLAYEEPTIDNTLVALHHKFKRDNGYSDLEISQKRSALEKVMQLDTADDHIERLKAAGFSYVCRWYQHFNFSSMVAIKAKNLG